MKGSGRDMAFAGTQMVASVLIGSMVGRALDVRWCSEPWCFVAGFVLGAAAGFRHFIRVARS